MILSGFIYTDSIAWRLTFVQNTNSSIRLQKIHLRPCMYVYVCTCVFGYVSVNNPPGIHQYIKIFSCFMSAKFSHFLTDKLSCFNGSSRLFAKDLQLLLPNVLQLKRHLETWGVRRENRNVIIFSPKYTKT